MAVGLERGERAPDMVLPTPDGTPTRYYAQAGGRPTLLILADVDAGERLAALGVLLAEAGGDLTVHVVAPAGLDASGLPFPVLVDAEGKAAAAYRTHGTSTAFVLDPNLRVRQALPFDDATAVAAAVSELLPELAWSAGDGPEIAVQAPVLVVPDVLTAEQCTELIGVWEEQGNVATGVEASAGGTRGEQLSAQLKRRRDHVVSDPDRTRDLAQTIGRRVIPEIARAFAYRARRFEGFKIACYEASDRGFFSAHRDNLSPSTAHRRFALTLNLNDGYAGGQLRFPEYGPQRYRPPQGAALLFSCSLLHEVLDVTEHRRFVLLSFLFGDEGRAPS
jgi:predicted 2-oxoglutarate/Fe(II)-dependent dioxygenase YbiX